MENRKQLVASQVEADCWIVGPPEWVEGLERRLVAQAAERAERQGAVEERSRGGRRVAPVEAEAAAFLRELLETCHEAASSFRHDAVESYAKGEKLVYAGHTGAAQVYEYLAGRIEAWLPKPESDADAGESTPSSLSIGTAYVPPDVGQRSGRRNVPAQARRSADGNQTDG